SVGAIDLKSNKIVAQVPVGTRPGPIVYGHGQWWVANLDNETVSKVDPKAQVQTDVISLGAQPNALAVQKTGVWVATDEGIKTIDPAFDSVSSIRIEKARPAGSEFYSSPTAIAFTPGSAWIVFGADLTRATPNTGHVLRRLTTGNEPAAVVGGGHDLWVTDTF